MKRKALLLCLILCFFKAYAQNERGDVNLDGQVDISDVTLLINYLLTGTWGEESVTPEGIECVDLGLPSSTLWAKWNIGAQKPEDYGTYFAWAETYPKGSYDWSTYWWCDGSYDTLTKYVAEDFNTELLPEDDAASVSWGAPWRIPSWEQLEELKNECIWQWTIFNNVSGQLVTGPNGNTLFLPAAGFKWDTLYAAGTYGAYWSRTLYFSIPYKACRLGFNSGGFTSYDQDDRFMGFTIRAVYDFQENCGSGDVNLDGQEDISDVTLLINYLLTGTWGDEPVTPGDPGPEYVDLGLPSGTLWATTNIPGYFAWGEITPTELYNWYYYKWCKGTFNTLTKYCTNSEYGYNGFIDNKTELDFEDDAAYVNWGPSWRMPTLSQWQELYNRCTWEWTGSGQLVTGPNGNTLFLPASGSYEHELCLGTGEIGVYWSSSLDYEYGTCYFAYILYFAKENINPYYWQGRSSGLKVRAVYVP